MPWKQLERMIALTRAAKGQSVGIQRKLLLSWASMLLALFAAVIMILSVAGVFSTAKQNLGYALTVQQNNTVSEINDQLSMLTAQGLSISRQTSDTLEDILLTADISAMNDAPNLLMTFQQNATGYLKTALQSSPCNGVYVVIDATTNTSAETAGVSRAGVYLRFANLSTKNAVNQDITWYRGIADVAREHRFELHNRWNLEFNSEKVTGFDALVGQTETDLLAHSGWSGRTNLPDTWENVFHLTVPVVGSNGVVQGICGVELSDLYFRLSYPAAESRFGNMITLLAPVQDETVELSEGMGTCLSDTGTLALKEGEFFHTYVGEYGTYLGLHTPLEMKMLDGTEMYVLTLIPEEGFLAVEQESRALWTICSLLILLVMLAPSILMTKRFVKPITDSLSALVTEKPQNLQNSGITEIDEIADFLRSRAQEQEELELPPNIEELFHDFAQRVKTLTPTERTILQYYIEGLSLEEMANRAYISINTAKKHNTNLNRKLSVKSREELLLYIDLFRRGGRLNEIAYFS